MNYSAIWTGTRDSSKRRALIELTFGSKLFDLACTGILVKTMIGLFKLLLKPGELFHDRCRVTDVALSHAFLLDRVFDGL